MVATPHLVPLEGRTSVTSAVSQNPWDPSHPGVASARSGLSLRTLQASLRSSMRLWVNLLHLRLRVSAAMRRHQRQVVAPMLAVMVALHRGPVHSLCTSHLTAGRRPSRQSSRMKAMVALVLMMRRRMAPKERITPRLVLLLRPWLRLARA